VHQLNLDASEEPELIDRAAQGQREAFGQLYKRHVSRVYRHIYYLVDDALLAEDLTAQTFLNALEAIPRYEKRGVPFLAWLLRIASNLTINYKKSQKNVPGRPLPETLEAKGTFYSPHEFCQVRIDSRRVWEVVRHLPIEQRQVIVMRFIDDLSYPDIAYLLEKSVGAVRVIQYRALLAVRRMLDDQPVGAEPTTSASSATTSGKAKAAVQ
jgi:RNA polymerase sigma-70 factor (ECF subfamily)